ncbi:MAG TPA: LCP family protein [Chloroflexia bacterium]|nr:LCP family protein [Chloroflexia bacterium]
MSHTDDTRTKSTPSNGNTRPTRPTAPSARPNPALQSGRSTTPFRPQGAQAPGVKSTAPNAGTAARATAVIRNRKRRRRIVQLVILLVAALLIGAGVLVATVVGPTVGALLGAGRVIFTTPVVERVGPGGTAVAAPTPPWSDKGSINILLLGLDFRGEENDTRADTQIVVHIDLAAKTASMLSIPRDLWVTIPGFGEGRINSSYQLGENNKDTIPGGGPNLAMSTIQQNFGIPIHYFAQVDFVGFERVLDAMGGIMVDVPRPLVDNEYPLVNFGATRIYIPAGLQHMDGRTALQYARSRHADNDIGRNARQQQVLLALKQQGLNLNIVSHLTDIVNELAGAVKTDLTFLQLTALAQLAKDIGPSSIQTLLIDIPLVNPTVLVSGADVLMPDWSLIRPKVLQMFGDPKLAKEAARISVLNGTEVGGVARKTGDLLIAQGLSVVNVASAPDAGSHPVTTITDYSGGTKQNTIAALAKELGIDPADVIEGDPAKAPLATSDGEAVDIVIIVGDDRAN